MEILLLISRLKRHGNQMREERCEQELKKKKRNDISLTPRSLFELINENTYIQEKQNKKGALLAGLLTLQCLTLWSKTPS